MLAHISAFANKCTIKHSFHTAATLKVWNFIKTTSHCSVCKKKTFLLLCLGMHSNVMFGFMVQACWIYRYVAALKKKLLQQCSPRVRVGEDNFCKSGCESTFFFNRSSTGMSHSHPGVYVIRQVTNVVRNLLLHENKGSFLIRFRRRKTRTLTLQNRKVRQK